MLLGIEYPKGVRAYCWSVSKRCVKRLLVRVKEILDVVQTLHLEFLGLLLNHLPATHTQFTLKK